MPDAELNERGWERVATLDGSESWGSSWEGHYLEVFSSDNLRWSWSMTHPFACEAHGAAGIAKTQRQAESKAIGEAEKCREFQKWADSLVMRSPSAGRGARKEPQRRRK